MQFRKDINGLRAIAVIAVVLFHFNSDWMPGGFAGVDVFFVISGFLMTGIIFRGIEQENFSILKFYVARANRIIPALAVLCLVLLIFGWFYLTPNDYKALGKHAGSSMTFVSNIIYQRESGYFDAASHEKWLLHTWSLSAEWQFYIIYPLVLVVMRKFISVNKMKAMVLFGTLLSFIYCVIVTYKSPDFAYYLLPTRAWEMMLGGVAFLYPLTIQDKRKKLLEWLGLALIVSSYFLISKENPWPGYWAIFPVLGTFLIIQAQRNDSLITSNVVFQKLGAWSYSIYLWHWPLVVAIYYFSLNDMFIYLGIALSVLLGFFSNIYIEKIRFRNDFGHIFSYWKCKPLYMILGVGLVASMIFGENGFFKRFNHIENIEKLASNRELAESYYMQNFMKAFSNNGELYEDSFLCTLDGGNQTASTAIECLNHKLGESGYLVVGDSHGRDFLHALMLSYPEVNFSMLHESGCVPTKYSYCFKILNDVIDDFVIGNDKLKGIILVSKYRAKISVVESFIDDINHDSYGKLPIFIVNSGPRLNSTIVDLSIRKNKITDYYELSYENDKAVEVNDKLSKIKGVELFDKYSVFCKLGRCKLNDGLEPYIWDKGHLSLLGITKVSKSISDSNFLNL